MSTVDWKDTSLLSKEYVRDKLFQEDGERYKTAIPPQGKVSYWDLRGTDHKESATPGLVVDVTYDTHNPQPFILKKDFRGRKITFKSRNELLDHEVARRMEERQNLPDKERYVGIQLTVWQKIKRWFNGYIDDELQIDWINALKPNYSAKNIYDMHVVMHPSKEVRSDLGIEARETHRLATKVTWCYNSSLNGYQYVDEAGKTVRIHNATTSSNDRTTANICMMRRIDDSDTSESIAYTGRPDTLNKAIEQVEFIFRSEMQKKREIRKGISEEDGIYTLTYVVNNLMSPLTGIGLISFDEKKATFNEKRVLEELAEKTLIIDGKKVRFKPLYFSQPFNKTTTLESVITDYYSGKKTAEEINRESYRSLYQMAEQNFLTMEPGPKKELLEAALQTLKNDKKTLLPEEELFNRALLTQGLNLPLVVHCKSSTDRTTLAYAVAAIAHQWNKLDLDFIREKRRIVPHLILQQDAAKELFAGHCLGAHPVTRVSRTCEGVVKGHEIGTRILGFEWSNNPVAGRMLPERYTKVTNVPSWIKRFIYIVTFLPIIILDIFAFTPICLSEMLNGHLRFNPFFIKPGIPIPQRLIDKNSPYVGKGAGRSLLKPGNMQKL